MRQPTEDEAADYREEANLERLEREQSRKRSRNTGKHVADPDREWPEGAEE